MKTCPTCGGAGVQTATVTTITPHAPCEVEEMRLGCVVCDGRGQVSNAKATQIERERSLWCECEDPSDDPRFWGDGEHPEIPKHHWRCRDCGKIQQIG